MTDRASSLMQVVASAAIAGGGKPIDGSRVDPESLAPRRKESIDDVLRPARANRGRSGWWQPGLGREARKC